MFAMKAWVLYCVLFLAALSLFAQSSFLPMLAQDAESGATTTIRGIAEGHCSEIGGNANNSTVVCLVWDRRPENFSEPRQLQIYRKGEKPQTIESGEIIREWHYWNNSQQLAVHFGGMGASGNFVLYDLASGKEAEHFSGAPDPSDLPQWAKSQSQVQDESVPEGPEYIQQRTAWIAKVLRRLDSVRPGMIRRDLDRTLTPDGGMSTRLQKTYLFVGCPYIKVDVRFRAAAGMTDSFGESPEDLIESVSKPYLEVSHAD